MSKLPSLGLVPWIQVISLSAAVFVVSVDPCSAGRDKWLEQEEDRNVERLLERYYQADKKDEELSNWFISGTDPLEQGRNWGGLFKRCATSVAAKPSVRGLLGTALAASRTQAERKNCIDRIHLKLQSFERTFEYLDAAIAFREAIGNKSDVDDTKFFKYHMRIIESQRLLFERQRECLCSPTSWKTAKPKRERR